MKKLMVALLALALMSSVAGAESWIGMFADDAATICDAEIGPGVPVDAFLYAVIDPSDFPNGITAAEFRLDNYPEAGADGMISESFSSPVNIGTLGWDFSIAWSSPQAPGNVHIGTLTFIAFTGNWIGADHLITVVEGNDCECLVVVDENYIQHDVGGGMFTFNCTGDCICYDGTASEETSWGAVKALF